jgi:hypothetical protein
MITTKPKGALPFMNCITQDMKYRQSLMTYAKNHGGSQTNRKYNRSRSYIFFWLARYVGSIESLVPKSKRPKLHPSQHAEAEIKLITDMRRCNPDSAAAIIQEVVLPSVTVVLKRRARGVHTAETTR